MRPRSRVSTVRKERGKMPTPEIVSRRSLPPYPRRPLPPTPQQSVPNRAALHSRQNPLSSFDDGSLPLLPEDYGYTKMVSTITIFNLCTHGRRTTNTIVMHPRDTYFTTRPMKKST